MILSNLKHRVKSALSSKYQRDFELSAELERIRSFPRYRLLSTNLLGNKLELVDSLSFYASYKEIFEREIYAFKCVSNYPFIIDGGANIGVSIIYFKEKYPKAKILAFEADPVIFEVLQRNISNFGYEDINLVNKALWNDETILEFSSEGADSGRLSRDIDEPIPKKLKVKVCTALLKDYLVRPVDLLKLDIEGAETDVIIDCSNHLGNVNSIFVEYHSFACEEQRLNELLSVLRSSGFRIQIQTQFCSLQPLLQESTHLGMDLQLNIFGYRK